MTNFQKITWGLGLLGLIPFILPLFIMPFVDGFTVNALETMQFAYAGIIIIFMGGAQWGYAVKQGVPAKPIQLIVSVIPTLIIFGILSFLPLFKPYQITIIFVGMLLAQAVFDYKTYTEQWFMKLRCVLTSVACLSLISMAILQNWV